jgi:hypothetical protein
MNEPFSKNLPEEHLHFFFFYNKQGDIIHFHEFVDYFPELDKCTKERYEKAAVETLRRVAAEFHIDVNDLEMLQAPEEFKLEVGRAYRIDVNSKKIKSRDIEFPPMEQDKSNEKKRDE